MVTGVGPKGDGRIEALFLFTCAEVPRLTSVYSMMPTHLTALGSLLTSPASVSHPTKCRSFHILLHPPTISVCLVRML